jgi:hypothetical protein
VGLYLNKFVTDASVEAVGFWHGGDQSSEVELDEVAHLLCRHCVLSSA